MPIELCMHWLPTDNSIRVTPIEQEELAALAPYTLSEIESMFTFPYFGVMNAPIDIGASGLNLGISSDIFAISTKWSRFLEISRLMQEHDVNIPWITSVMNVWSEMHWDQLSTASEVNAYISRVQIHNLYEVIVKYTINREKWVTLFVPPGAFSNLDGHLNYRIIDRIYSDMDEDAGELPESIRVFVGALNNHMYNGIRDSRRYKPSFILPSGVPGGLYYSSGMSGAFPIVNEFREIIHKTLTVSRTLCGLFSIQSSKEIEEAKKQIVKTLSPLIRKFTSDKLSDKDIGNIIAANITAAGGPIT